MLVNNQNAYTAGMIVPNMPSINREIEKRGLKLGKEDATKEALKIIQHEVDAYKSGGKYAGSFPERWLPSTMVILPEAFTEQNQLINSTMKMVRVKIAEYFKAELDFLYTSEAKNIINKMNMETLKKWQVQDND
jgi:long-chain acyl-CoA synthetase